VAKSDCLTNGIPHEIRVIGVFVKENKGYLILMILIFAWGCSYPVNDIDMRFIISQCKDPYLPAIIMG